MPSLSLLDLALIFGLWNLVFITIYAALCWFGGRFPRALCWFGSIALVGWGLIFGYFDLLHIPHSVYLPYPTVAVLSIGALLISTLAGGGALIRLATQKQLIWWHGVLFTALYLLLVQSAIYYLLGAHPKIKDMLDEATVRLWAAFGLDPYQWYSYGQLVIPNLIWIYSLTVPLFESLVRSLYRAYQQNQTSSFA